MDLYLNATSLLMAMKFSN